MKEYNLIINGNEYTVSIDSVDKSSAKVVVNGSSYTVEHDMGKKDSAPRVTHVDPVPGVSKREPTPRAAAPAAPAAKPSSGTGAQVKSPLPGLILEIKVNPGDAIKTGDTLVVLEAMKMENNIDSLQDGVVKSVEILRGDSVLEGDVLITFE